MKLKAHWKKLSRRKRIALFCILAGVILIVVAVILFLKREAPEPVPALFVSPIAYTVYLPLAIYEKPIKHGVGVPYGYSGIPVICSQMQELGIDWYYNWAPAAEISDCPGVEYVPMIWHPPMIGDEIPGSAWLLGFNECDGIGQCNTSPGDAAIAWRELEQVYPGVRLVSPATAYGTSWLEEWHQAYVDLYGEPPRLDAIAVHCYGPLEVCQPHILEFVAFADDLPVWVTEFGWPPHIDGYEQTLVVMEEMVAWFEATPQITRWAWFAHSFRGDEWWANWGTPNTSLVDFDTGELTPCGELYQDLAP